MLNDIVALAPLTLLAAKSAIDATIAAGPYDPAAAIAALQRCFVSRDYAEGRSAFADKRPPKFLGQ
jgi:enoyl-CoA hydratase